MLFLKICLWILCGIGAAGMLVAYFQNEFPQMAEEEYKYDLRFGLIFGPLFGPLALVVAFFFTTGFMKHGWSLKPLNKQRRT